MRRAPPLLIRERFVVFFIDDSGNAIVGIVHSVFILLVPWPEMTKLTVTAMIHPIIFIRFKSIKTLS